MLQDFCCKGGAFASPHHGPKRLQTLYLVVHYTQITPLNKVLSHFQHPNNKVSCHYIIDADGTCVEMIPHALTAWHAGKSAWREHTHLNQTSIGIELVYTPYHRGAPFQPFPAAQMATLIQLLKHLCQQYNLPPTAIIGHSDIAVGRKKDPGPSFPWSVLRQKGLGLSSALCTQDEDQAFFAAPPPSYEQVRAWLWQIGYRFAPWQLPDALWAFQSHFRAPWPSGTLDALTAARLYALARTL